MFYDLIIVGGGPAAIAAAVYAKRKLFNTLLLTRDLSGAFEPSLGIRNFIGMTSISGEGLTKMLKAHLKSCEGPGLKVLMNKNIENISKIEKGFQVKTESAEIYETKFVLIATGRTERKLKAEGASEFEGRGIFYCVECDAPLMQGKNVAVIGSGDSGLYAAKTLLSYAKKIYIITRSSQIKGEEITRQELELSGKAVFITDADIVKFDAKGIVVAGKKFLQELTYRDLKDGKEKIIEVEGVFVKIGSQANSLPVKDVVKLTKEGDIVVDSANCRTSCFGVWAAGDVTDCPYRQINIAIGDAVKAILDMGTLL